MTIFDAEDWQQLENEIMELYSRSFPPQEFQKELSSILHEWAESAVAIGSSELAEVFTDVFPEDAALLRDIELSTFKPRFHGF